MNWLELLCVEKEQKGYILNNNTFEQSVERIHKDHNSFMLVQLYIQQVIISYVNAKSEWTESPLVPPSSSNAQNIRKVTAEKILAHLMPSFLIYYI